MMKSLHPSGDGCGGVDVDDKVEANNAANARS